MSGPFFSGSDLRFHLVSPPGKAGFLFAFLAIAPVLMVLSLLKFAQWCVDTLPPTWCGRYSNIRILCYRTFLLIFSAYFLKRTSHRDDFFTLKKNDLPTLFKPYRECMGQLADFLFKRTQTRQILYRSFKCTVEFPIVSVRKLVSYYEF